MKTKLTDVLMKEIYLMLMKDIRNKNRAIIFCRSLAKALDLQHKVYIDFLEEEGRIFVSSTPLFETSMPFRLSGKEHKICRDRDLIFVLTEIYELNSYTPSLIFADIKIDIYDNIPVAIILMKPDRED